MNTNQLKKFAKEARIKLITQIGVKLDFVLTQDTAELRGKSNELAQLRSKLSELGRDQLIETVAYTWFNRLMALRFMDANGYNTPKVVTPLPGMTNPEMLQNALAGNIEQDLKLDRQRLNDLIDGRTSSSDAQTEAFKLLLVASCNKWHSAMPFMFERISDYTELLLPDDLLSDFSIVSDIINGMSDDDCQQEELIGWLYQFYISDKKDDVFDGLKKNIKITAENIPAATQLFTPRWIVRYMVENTLGKLWLTFKPSSKLRQHMPYFIDTPEGNNLPPVPENIKGITDVTFLDPCQGSGHVLVYAFDLLIKIYEEEGYNNSEIPSLILEHNLFGIDIDERAAQLAAFSLTMKARNYYSRFLRNPIQPQVIALENINENIIKDAVKLPITVDGKLIDDYRDLTLFNLTQADNFGSLVQLAPEELKALKIQKGSIWQEQEQKLKNQAEYLSRKYFCVVTNPPYMGSRNMNETLREYVHRFYPISKRDLFSTFIERCMHFSVEGGIYSLINQQSWMFTNDFKELRSFLLKNQQIQNVVHLGPGVFDEISGEIVQSVSFTVENSLPVQENKTNFVDCTDVRGSSNKEVIYLSQKNNPIKRSQYDFYELEGLSFAYWISPRTSSLIKNAKKLSFFSEIKQGLATGDNNTFLRYWYEVSRNKIQFNRQNGESSLSKWFPYNKGGGFQRFYGNNEFICNWENDGEAIKNDKLRRLDAGLILPSNSKPKNTQYFFKKGISFNLTGDFSARFKEDGYIFDVQGSSLFPPENMLFPILGFLNSKLVKPLLRITNPTLVTQVGDVKTLPILFDHQNQHIIELENITKELVFHYTELWDFRELSWDFNNIILFLEFKPSTLLSESMSKISTLVHNKFNQITKLQTDLNKILIEIYELRDEMDPVTQYSDITTPNEEINLKEGIEIVYSSIITSIFSFSVGNLFGRYSIDKQGLIIANQGENLQDFLRQIPTPNFLPDEDNIIPVLDGEWFNDDIVGRFKSFLKAAFGEKHFDENLRYIEEVIDKEIRKYFVKDFYNDHLKRYKKRPIYWMFSSPKGHFKALIYMHRYQPDLCSKMLNDYLQPFISKLEAAKQTNTLLALREDVTAREKTLALKEVDRLELMIRDCKDYERTLFTIATQKITIDLDDGVKVNYLKFKEVLVPIKGLEKEED